MNAMPSTYMTFRDARRSDAREITDLHQLAAGGVAELVWKALCLPGEKIIEAGVRETLAILDRIQEDVSITVAECRGQVAGLIWSHAETASPPEEFDIDLPALAPFNNIGNDDAYYVNALAVHDGFRGKGVAAKFLCLAESRARRLGYKRLTMHVYEENPPALSLYRKRGFQEIDRKPIPDVSGFEYAGDVLLMSKPVISMRELAAGQMI